MKLNNKKEAKTMLVTLRQEIGKKWRCFNVKQDGNAFLKIETPWEKALEVCHMEDLAKISFYDESGRSKFHTGCRLVSDQHGSVISLEQINAIGPRFYQLFITSEKGKEGSFYLEPSGKFADGIRLESHGKEICGTTFYDEQTQGVAFFENDRQVAQLTRPLRSKQHLAIFYLHIAPGSEELLPLLLYFCLYCDTRRLHHGTSSLSYQKKAPDPYWVTTTFGSEATADFQKMLDEQDPRPLKNKGIQLLLAFFLSIVPFVLAIFFLFGNLIPNEKDSLGAEAFEDEIQAQGFSLKKRKARRIFSKATTVQFAQAPNCQLEFYAFDDKASTEEAYDSAKAELVAQEPSIFERNYFTMAQYAFYSLTDETDYTFVARLGKTVLYCQATSQNKKEVEKVIKELGYR